LFILNLSWFNEQIPNTCRIKKILYRPIKKEVLGQCHSLATHQRCKLAYLWNLVSIHMSNLGINISIDDEIINDFRENLSDQYEIAAQAVQELESDASNSDAVHRVFRALHTVKGNSNLCQLDILTRFSHAVEEIAVAMRQGEVSYKPILGELILLSMDKIKEVSEDLFNNREVDTDLLHQVETLLADIAKQPKTSLTKNAAKIISLFSNQTLQTQGMEAYAFENLVTSPTTGQYTPKQSGLSGNLASGLAYFKQLSLLLESKIPYWEGRIQRTMPLAIGLNELMGSPEDPVQLTAALYMHDIGFAFLDERFWNSQIKFTASDFKQMQAHPELAANLMAQMPEWNEAREIVIQHHERWDGTGYPNKLKGDSIRPGAQLLSVIDAFESMTHSRPDRTYKRSILRAMTEINNCSGTQFSPHITALFNTVVRDTLTHRKK